MVDAPGGDMGAVMREASKIKTAQLKQRPGRQLWEEAPEWFKGGTLKRPRSGGVGGTSGDGAHSFAERHSRAMSLKREGNAAFGNGNLELALACYVRSAAEWAWFEQRGEDMPLVRSYADIEDEEQRCVCDRMPRQTQHNPSVRAACTLSRTRTLTRACISRSRARLRPGIAP